MFKYWNWEDTSGIIFTAVVISALVLIGISITADHQVINYELHQSNGAVCVYNIRNWTNNDQAFCGSSENAIDVYLALKNLLQKKNKTQPPPPQVVIPNEVEL